MLGALAAHASPRCGFPLDWVRSLGECFVFNNIMGSFRISYLPVRLPGTGMSCQSALRIFACLGSIFWAIALFSMTSRVRFVTFLFARLALPCRFSSSL
jgi:hypothetical protein